MAKKKENLNVQPHSEDAELAVLGSMLSSKEAVSKAIQHLKSEYFYKSAHSQIFSVMLILFGFECCSQRAAILTVWPQTSKLNLC